VDDYVLVLSLTRTCTSLITNPIAVVYFTVTAVESMGEFSLHNEKRHRCSSSMTVLEEPATFVRTWNISLYTEALECSQN
jgi:hypothetical protein